MTQPIAYFLWSFQYLHRHNLLRTGRFCYHRLCAVLRKSQTMYAGIILFATLWVTPKSVTSHSL